jgi:hypothetical protein
MDDDMNSTLMNHMSTIRRLLRQETESLKSPDHEWKRCQKKSMHNPIWRKMVVEWCYQVIDHVSADRELVYMTMNILDRFVAVKSSSSEDTCQRQNIFFTDKKSYETAVMTSLLITTKIQGIENLDIPDLVTMSSNSVRSKDIIETGKDVIQSLSWNNQVPTAARFAHAFIQLLPQNMPHATKMSIYEDSIDKIELSVQFEAFSRHPPSSVAWMVVENSLDANLVPHDIKSSLREQIHQLGIDHDENLYHHLELLDYRKVPTSGFKLNVIPLDENDNTDHNCIQTISEPRKFSPRSIPLITNVVSLEDMVMISPLPQENDAASKKRHFTEDVAQEIPKLRRISKRHYL